MASTGIASVTTASTSSASAQPKVWISVCPSGAKTNWPIEPAAVPMPKTIERFSGGTRRPKAASTMEKDAAAMPRPIIRPAETLQPERRRRPGHHEQAGRIDDDRRRRARGRSRSGRRCAPAIGWPMPHMMFWMAIDSAKISRLQPCASVIGARKRPMIERGPKESSEIRQPATITIGSATAAARRRAECGDGHRVVLAILERLVYRISRHEKIATF